MKRICEICVVLSLFISAAVAFLGTGLLDINLFKCVQRKAYSCPHDDIDFTLHSPTNLWQLPPDKHEDESNGTIFPNGSPLNFNIFRCVKRRSTICPHPDVNFFLHTPEVPNGVYVDVRKPRLFAKAGFRPEAETVFIVHGFNGTARDRHMRYLKDAYLSRDFNVVMVDWKKLTYYPCYFSALGNTKLVAQCTAQIYAFLTYKGSSNEQMTCVGHSLGAHICGMVSNHLTSKQHKIIGLDPARPLIEQHASRAYRLTRDDATNVQIIHTNAGTLGQVAFTGSLDLCINGGMLQPFCRRGFRLNRNRCSHFLSVCYLANAIFKHKLFPYVPCRSGCVPNNSPIFGYRTIKHQSSLVKYMHIGQDVPEELTGAYCVQVDFAKHCPFNED